VPFDRHDRSASRDDVVVAREGARDDRSVVFAPSGDVRELGDVAPSLGDDISDTAAAVRSFRHGVEVDRDVGEAHWGEVPLDRHVACEVWALVGGRGAVGKVRRHVVPVNRHVVPESPKDVRAE
jgi:hypothetical protein